jgi:hypothetical protein
MGQVSDNLKEEYAAIKANVTLHSKQNSCNLPSQPPGRRNVTISELKWEKNRREFNFEWVA